MLLSASVASGFALLGVQWRRVDEQAERLRAVEANHVATIRELDAIHAAVGRIDAKLDRLTER